MFLCKSGLRALESNTDVTKLINCEVTVDKIQMRKEKKPKKNQTAHSAIMTTACIQICYANMSPSANPLPIVFFLQVACLFPEDAITIKRQQSSPGDSKSATPHSLSGFPACTKTS